MKKIISVFLAAAIILGTTTVFAENDSAVSEIHVSPNGSDSNSGTAEAPVKTVAEAQKRARKANDGKTDVEVIFHEGEYRITNTLQMTSDDSGTDEHPVTWRAAEGEKPVFKGSLELDVTKFKKIENQSVYERLHENAKGKVAVLDLKSQGVSELATLFAGSYGSYSEGYNNIYVDGTAQTLARWPNNDYAKLGKVIDASKGVFMVNDSAPTRWGNAEDARIAGLLCWDWAYERTEVTAVDPETRYLTINAKRTISQNISNAGGRYFIYNLLEEIDVPGEWYIDKNEMMLYYYPVYPLSNSTMEISVLRTPMIEMTSVSNVNIIGLEFCQTTTDVIQMTMCKNINISGCDFHDIGRSAINGANTSKPDNVRNVIVENNSFNHMEMKAVYMTGGDEETLEESGCVIRNNYFSDLGTVKRSYEGAVRVDGVGFLIENNTISNAPHLAINVGGSLHKIRYNEIYDVCKESNDMGAIYTGRNAYRRGYEISYNYIHDLVPEEGLAGLVCGVYWDDSQSGGDIHHNIFKNVPRSVFYNGGNDAYVHDNISIDSSMGFQFSYTANETVNQNLFVGAIEYANAHPVYYEYFPELKDIDINYTKSHNNRVTDNLMVNAYGNSMTALNAPEWSTDPNSTNYARQNLSYNNVSVESVDKFTDFNAPEKGDYTIKEGAEILKTLPGISEIKLSKIGAKGFEEKAEAEEFKKIYPKNGEKNVTAAKLELKWEPAAYRTDYHVRVATDKEMKNIVFETSAKVNYCMAEGLSSGGKIYYWQVTATDGIASFEIDEKSAYGAVYSFATSRTDKLDQLVLTQNIAKAEKFLAMVGVGDAPGQCNAEVMASFEEVLNKAKAMNAKKYGSQNELDEINAHLEQALASIPKDVHKGYAQLDEWLSSSDNWHGDFTLTEDKEMLITSGNYAISNELVTTYQIYKFRVKVPDFGSSFFTVAFKINAMGSTWSPSTVNYSFYFKENLIELQRYCRGGGIIETYDNNGLMKAGEWAELEIGTLDVEGGIQVFVKLNNEVIFNYFDDSGLISEDGYLQFGAVGDVQELYVRPSENHAEFDESIVMGGKIDYNDLKYTDYTSADFEDDTLKGELSQNEIAGLELIMDPANEGQSIVIQKDDDKYVFAVTEEKITLTRYSAKGNQILYIGNNELFLIGKTVKINVGAVKNADGTRVVLYADGKRIVDCIDAYGAITGGTLRIIDDNKKGISVR